MTVLPLKHLVVFDVDHTIGDIFDGWAVATDAALDALALSRAIPRQILEDAIINLEKRGHFLIYHFGELLVHLDCLRPLDDFEETDARIIHDWLRLREGATRAYDGVFDTMAALHAAGARIALYTDSVLSPLLHRLWLMEIPLALIDRIYCQPDVISHAPPMAFENAQTAYKKAALAKTVCLPAGSPKPNPDNMRRILDDCGVAAAYAVMVGDHVNDGGSARGAGVDFAWQYQGVRVQDHTLALYDRLFAGFSYRIGPDAMQAQFTDHNRPHVILTNGLPDLFHYYRFTAPV